MCVWGGAVGGCARARVRAPVAQSCLTLCDAMDCSPPGSSVHGFSRQGYWSGFPFPSPGDLPNPGIAPSSPALQADSLPSKPPGKPRLLVWMRANAGEWLTRILLPTLEPECAGSHPALHLVGVCSYSGDVPLLWLSFAHLKWE